MCLQELIILKLEYIHQNPVLAGYVEDAENWKNSSAKAYSLDGSNFCSFDIEFIR